MIARHALRPRARDVRGGRARLSRSSEFDRVFRNGRSVSGREFVVYVFPRGDGDEPRLGLSVSRKVGGAVERNRVKRVLREAFRLETGCLPEGMDAVVVARPAAKALVEREGLAGVREALRPLLSRWGAPGEDSPSRIGLAAKEQDSAPAVPEE